LSGFEIGSVSNGPAVADVHQLKVASETEEAHDFGLMTALLALG
jgi:hypothetical protein